MVFDALNLNQDQIGELIDPPKIKIEDPSIDGMVEFIKTSQKIIVCGDFDADGVTSTSIAALILESLNIEYGFYIPDRIQEGYGTSVKTIQHAFDKGYTHVLMVDNGVKAFEAIELAHHLGMKVGIVDHHNYDEIPAVDAFLHPDLLGSYGSAMSAAGLMYLLAEAMDVLNVRIVALACIGTIADVMPLWHKNREIVRYGLELLNRYEYLQIDALCNRSKYTSYTASFLAFNVIPKINSVGRLADHENMNHVVRYLLSDQPEAIRTYSKRILALNDMRKDLSSEMAETAKALSHSNLAANIIINEDFHEGILGIVANRLLQETQKPSILMKDMGSLLKGSSRSSSISLSELYAGMNPDYFHALGGHDFAYGLTVKKEYLNEFCEAVYSGVSKLPVIAQHIAVLNVDASLLSKEALMELQTFEPFGEGFKIPLVQVEINQGFTISPINAIGYKFQFQNPGLEEAVIFSTQYPIEVLKTAKKITGQVSYNSFRKVSMMIESIDF